ncbi:methionine ABC transporter ATP-binding protein [Bacillaceae bacterium Marseille-Q3522]|nr:methionine ABC transporter ATP-binding protein [Bacillaceae bacterium Marseille-Q3522]
MIELKDIYKTYQRNGISIEALKGVNVKVETGDIFGVIGYSGAGKSTLIRLVNYLEKPTEGQVLVDGADLADFTVRQLRVVKKRIGMIFQHFNLLESKKIYDNVAIPLVLLKKSKREIRERVTELLEFVGLSEKANSYPSELSGGQKQRVGIARALASNPSILLCDEATSALDPQTTHSILQLLKKINAEYNITIMIITHEMSVIQEICNRVAVMEEGKIIEQGSVLEVFGQPKHPTTRNFVRTVFHHQVPDGIKDTQKIGAEGKLLTLKFIGESASEPIINNVIRTYDITINILSANTSEIQGTTLANMTLQINGDPAAVNAALQYIKDQGVKVKEADY